MVRSSAPSLSAIQTLILDLVPHLEPSPRPPGPGRPPVVSLSLLWSALLFTMLDGPLSQRAVWSRITSGGIPRYPALVVTNEAIRQRLLGMDPATMADAFAAITTACRATITPLITVPAFSGGIFALDTTTLDKIARPLLGETERRLAGRIHTLYDVSRQLFHTVILTPKPREHEQVAAPDLLAQVPEKSLVVMDRGYTSYPRFDALTDQGQAFITRLRENAAFTTRHVMTDTPEVRDELIWLGAYRADRAGHTYRLVTLRGRQAERRYLTNVLEPTTLSPAQVAACYRERWEIERAFATLKRDLGLAWIWSQRTEVIWVQVWATLLLAQIMSVVRQAVAARAGVPVAQVSMRLLIRSAPMFLAGREGDLIEIMARDGPNWGLIRPVRRVTIEVPGEVPWTPWPADLPMTRASRYARKP